MGTHLFDLVVSEFTGAVVSESPTAKSMALSSEETVYWRGLGVRHRPSLPMTVKHGGLVVMAASDQTGSMLRRSHRVAAARDRKLFGRDSN